LARPGSASAALGSAVVLRMNNMDYLPARCIRTYVTNVCA
jgi:hypothetical protein